MEEESKSKDNGEADVFTIRKELQNLFTKETEKESIPKQLLEKLKVYRPAFESIFQILHQHPLHKALNSLVFEPEMEKFRNVHLGDVQFLFAVEQLFKKLDKGENQILSWTNKDMSTLLFSKYNSRWADLVKDMSHEAPSTSIFDSLIQSIPSSSLCLQTNEQ